MIQPNTQTLNEARAQVRQSIKQAQAKGQARPQARPQPQRLANTPQNTNAPQIPAKIDRKNNLVLTLADEDGSINKIFVPEPTRAAFESVLKVLQKFYTMAVTNELPADIIVRDYAELVKEIYGDDNVAINRVNSFLDRALMGSTIFTADGAFIPYADCGWSDEVKGMCEGTLLFTSALYRYVPIQARKTILTDIITSLPLTEWKTACLNSYTEQMEITQEEMGAAIEGYDYATEAQTEQ